MRELTRFYQPEKMTDMKRSWILGTLAAVVVLTCLLALGRHNNDLNAEESSLKEEVTTTASQQDKQPDNDTLTISQDELLDNNNDFACNLFRTINKNRKLSDGSIVVSPISVSYVLGMLNEGASGKTCQQITDVLGLSGSTQQINEYFKTMIHKVSRVDSNVTLQLANCIDVNSAKGISLIPQYKADMQQYYDAQIDALDFTQRSSLDKINNWCNKHTGGMIPTAVDRLDPDAVLYLLNAIYFKAKWTEKFNPEDTRIMNFTTQNGTVVKHNMMHRQTRTLYGKNKICQMLYLPYGNKDFGMYVLLPVKGKTTADIIQGLSARELEQQLNGMKDENVDILMPRFYTSSETTLNHVLSAMGMPLVFTSRAELPNMAQGEKDLYVSLIDQKTIIEVNEKGTEGTARTLMRVLKDGDEPPKIENFHATHPFVYLIIEKRSGAIFFMGTYCGEDCVQPAKSDGIVVVPHTLKEEIKIYSSAEQMPQFPGGEAALMKYIQSHIQYPPTAAKNHVQGRVIVQFVVWKDGSVSEVNVVRSVDNDLDREAVRVCKTLPKFTPGRQNGKAVDVWYTVPVTFKLP
jgi:serpin B